MLNKIKLFKGCLAGHRYTDGGIGYITMPKAAEGTLFVVYELADENNCHRGFEIRRQRKGDERKFIRDYNGVSYEDWCKAN